jgi:hypothetical protein
LFIPRCSFRSPSCNRSTAASKRSSPDRLKLSESFLIHKVILLFFTSSPSSSRAFYLSFNNVFRGSFVANCLNPVKTVFVLYFAVCSFPPWLNVIRFHFSQVIYIGPNDIHPLPATHFKTFKALLKFLKDSAPYNATLQTVSYTKLCPTPNCVLHQIVSYTKLCPTPNCVLHQIVSHTKLCPTLNCDLHQIVPYSKLCPTPNCVLH